MRLRIFRGAFGKGGRGFEYEHVPAASRVICRNCRNSLMARDVWWACKKPRLNCFATNSAACTLPARGFSREVRARRISGYPLQSPFRTSKLLELIAARRSLNLPQAEAAILNM